MSAIHFPTEQERAADEFNKRMMVATLAANMLHGAPFVTAIAKDRDSFRKKEQQVDGAIETAKMVMAKLGLIQVNQQQQPASNGRPPGA